MAEPLAAPNMAPARARLIGIGLMVLTVMLFPFMDATAKYLGERYPVAQVVWGRYVFHLVVVAVLLARRDGLRFLIPRSPKLQFVRAVLILGATSLFFTAIPHIPLANAIAINFLAPFLVVVFAIPMLGEKVEWQRWVVLVIGFSSTLLIIKPGMAGFHWASLLCCCSASCYALYQIVTRRLAAIDHPYTTLFFTGAAGVVASSVAVPFVWVPPTPTVWALLAIMGVIGGLSHFLLIQAYRYAAASTLAPFSYTQIVTGTLIGYVWFGTFPDGMAIVGMMAIAACGLYLVFRATRRA
jgi:drug/metabolite transporter (DMT)-like permease